MNKLRMLVAVGVMSVWAVPRAGTAQLSTQSTLGQSTGSSSSSQSTHSLPPIDGQSPDADKNDPIAATREAQRTRSVMNERQKRMIQDTDKLLALATELKQQMDKTSKNEMSLDVIKKAEEIERLAHDVKIRMKG